MALEPAIKDNSGKDTTWTNAYNKATSMIYVYVTMDGVAFCIPIPKNEVDNTNKGYMSGAIVSTTLYYFVQANVTPTAIAITGYKNGASYTHTEYYYYT